MLQLEFRGQIDPEVKLLDWNIFEWDIRIDPEVKFRINPDLPHKKAGLPDCFTTLLTINYLYDTILEHERT